MIRSLKGWIGILIGLAIALLLGVALYRGWSLNQKRAVASKVKRGEIPVQVAPVVARPITHTISLSGDILPQMQVEIFPKVSGYLERIDVGLGDTVRKGQVIAQIDRSDYLQKVRESEARVALARAQLAEIEAGPRAEEIRQAEEAVQSARSRYEHAKLHRERMEALFKQQVISKKEMDLTRMEYSVAEAQLASAQEQLKLLREGPRQEVREASRARLKEMEALLAQDRIRLQHTEITAPFSGEINRKYVEIGSLVTPSSPIVSLVHTETVKVVAHILERDIPYLKLGMKAKIQTESFPGKVFEGKVARISSGLDPVTRTLQAEIDIPNPGRLLKPSMFARIEIVLFEKPRTLVVPREAIVYSSGSKAIFLHRGNQAIRSQVLTGFEQEGYVEILEGAAEGDQVIVKGQELLKDRSPVRVVGGG